MMNVDRYLDLRGCNAARRERGSVVDIGEPVRGSLLGGTTEKTALDNTLKGMRKSAVEGKLGTLIDKR